MTAARILHALALDALNLLTAPARAALAWLDERYADAINSKDD